MDYLAVEDILVKRLEEAGLLDGFCRLDFVVEHRRYQPLQSWICETATGLRIVRHLQEEVSPRPEDR